jgi:hypothetical protein
MPTARKDLFDCSASFNMGRGSKSSVHARVLVLHLPPCKSSSHVIVDEDLGCMSVKKTIAGILLASCKCCLSYVSSVA